MSLHTLILIRLVLHLAMVLTVWVMAVVLIVLDHPWAGAVFVVLGILCASGSNTPKPPDEDRNPEPDHPPDTAVKPKLEPECLR